MNSFVTKWMPVAFTCLTALCVGGANAGVVVSYSFDDTFAPSNLDANIVASNFLDQASGLSSSFLGNVRGSNLTRFVNEDSDGAGPGTADSRALGIASQRDFEPGVTPGTAPGGRTAVNTFFQFTIAPNPDFQLALTDLSFDTSLFSNVGGNTQTRFVLSANTFDGSGFNIVDTKESSLLAGNGDTAYETLSFDLTSLALAGGQTVEFRFDPQSTLSANGNVIQRRFTLDNMVVNGSVNAVPEPSSALTLGLGMLSIGLIRRRRQQ